MDESQSITLRQYTVVGEAVSNERAVWLQDPVESSGDAGLAVFLDGEFYFAHLGAPLAMIDLQKSGDLPPMWSVYVASREREVRHPESFCNAEFASFICDELVPQVREKTGASGESLLIGVSLTGLSAAHIALSRPGVFRRVLCHSGSFWWERGKLASEVGDWPASDTFFRITVGDQETDVDVDHGHGLIQVDSQIDCNRQMRDALIEHGYRVSYNEFDGGHDITSWRRDLRGDLSALASER